MVVREIDAESERVANSIVILGGAVFVLAIIIKLITGENFLSTILAVLLGFIIAIVYYIKSTFDYKKNKKETPKMEVDGS